MNEYTTFYFHTKRTHKSYWAENVKPNGKVLLLSDDGVSVGKTSLDYLKRNYIPDSDSTFGETIPEEEFWKRFQKWYDFVLKRRSK